MTTETQALPASAVAPPSHDELAARFPPRYAIEKISKFRYAVHRVSFGGFLPGDGSAAGESPVWNVTRLTENVGREDAQAIYDDLVHSKHGVRSEVRPELRPRML